ncbi:hypothetical protein Amsp01_100350 [Amycolatopsis sp. NBRC 101858]|uniref:hypothetical protein n=1 Tax=Amycolatopsis sp. NBRC 101858 TaxID=3032200 RepID=UPI0024A31722|nr:hypothetical protein [Amycolatopsis sp. NBRC 101858]GLY44012.1 hypothetical protein Amsp01_100350 [Amycolatopsis sp. NBRC 101858]
MSEETVVTTQYGGRMLGAVPTMGGTLMLTDRRLVFLPLIGRSGLQLSNRAAKHSAKLHDWNFHPQRLLNALVMPLTAQIDIGLDTIIAVTATRRCALLARWDSAGKERKLEFSISAHFVTPIWNPENIVCRDRFLAALKEAVAGSSAW